MNVGAKDFGLKSFLIILALLVPWEISQAVEPEHGPATTELIGILERQPGVKSMLISSLQQAKEINPDRETNPVQTLDEYLEFVSHAEKAMPWNLLYRGNRPGIFDDTFQSLVYFYFLLDQPLPELAGRGLVNNSLQYAEPIASWLVSFSKSWGRYLDSEDSWNEAIYQRALDEPAFGLQRGWYEDPAHWKTFNDFFVRHLRSPDMRPIAAPGDNAVVASYADSVPQGTWAIDGDSRLLPRDGAPVKSATIRSARDLIGKGSAYRDAFANGTFTHSFLNVNDYHRYHFPLGGTVREVRIIEGVNPVGGTTWWDADNRRYAFDPGTRLGWQSVETRGCVILDTGEYGLMALLPIGMGPVSSVNFEDHVKPGAVVAKGDMLGHFAFGGSDFIMLFQDKVEFTLDAPTSDDGLSYQHLLMGERMGYLTPRDR